MAATDSEKIQGDKCVLLFRQLIEQKIIVSMYVEGTDFEQLTVITGLEQTPFGEHLIIDAPSGFTAAVNNTNDWTLRFTLNGPDKLEYLFSTQGGTCSDNEIKVPFPESVQRLQRRKDFRVNTLPNTKLLFVNPDLKGVILLNNISMGGVFGALVKHSRKNSNGSLLDVHQLVRNIAITFPAHGDIEKQVVMIKKAKVVRIERDQQRHVYRYALEFKGMSRDQEALLRHTIYQIQRYYLKNR
jgi:hypothetical protein